MCGTAVIQFGQGKRSRGGDFLGIAINNYVLKHIWFKQEFCHLYNPLWFHWDIEGDVLICLLIYSTGKNH